MSAPRNKPRIAKAPAPAPEPKPVQAPDLADNEIIIRTKAGNGLKVELVPPASMALRNEVTYALAESEARAVMAALGLCSRKIQHNVPYTLATNIHAYGMQVMDWMLLQGVTYHDALNAGKMAWRVISQGLLTAREVDEAEGFIVPPADPSTA